MLVSIIILPYSNAFRTTFQCLHLAKVVKMSFKRCIVVLYTQQNKIVAILVEHFVTSACFHDYPY